jgi:hypothetical protein
MAPRNWTAADAVAFDAVQVDASLGANSGAKR